MMADNLIGISDLDRKAPIWNVSTEETIREMSLRQVLYSMIKMKDGHFLFAKIHSRGQ